MLAGNTQSYSNAHRERYAAFWQFETCVVTNRVSRVIIEIVCVAFGF